MPQKNTIVDGIIHPKKPWYNELNLLREIVLSCSLTEEVKWRQACYTFAGRNVLILASFKEWVIVNFFQGALLHDPYKILSKHGDHTRAERQIKVTSLKEIVAKKEQIIEYIEEAKKLAESGKKFDYSQTPDLEMPEELIQILEKDSEYAEAFAALTPGRRRYYILHFSQPKQSKTKIARIERAKPDILLGRGLNEYKDS